jgi:Protein of unknown function (DUF3748)/WD40-like Beta Propeller Repeat
MAPPVVTPIPHSPNPIGGEVPFPTRSNQQVGKLRRWSAACVWPGRRRQTNKALLSLAGAMAGLAVVPTTVGSRASLPLIPMKTVEKQITSKHTGHVLTNAGVWSPDGQWIVYDTRSDLAGGTFDGSFIEMVNVLTGEVRTLYQSRNEAHCGVASFNPRENKVVFILGPEHPTPDWPYCAWHRQGVIVDVNRPGEVTNLDACDLVPPFTPGALRGGTHLHVWDGAGQWVSFTYEDHVLSGIKNKSGERVTSQRNVGVSVPNHPVQVSRDHPRNHDGQYFSALITRTTTNPPPGSDQISRASEEAWVGTNGYLKAGGARQQRALAFQGEVISARGEAIKEVFVVDLPDDISVVGDLPLQGTETSQPSAPRGAFQRRLTFTGERRFPGLQGPRHWLRSSPDGDRIGFLMKDDEGVAQLWTISPNGGPPVQVSHNPFPVASAFSWAPDGRHVAHVMDNSVCVTDASGGGTVRLTVRSQDATAPRPECCVFSPDGARIAYVRPVEDGGRWFNQVWVCNCMQP